MAPPQAHSTEHPVYILFVPISAVKLYNRVCIYCLVNILMRNLHIKKRYCTCSFLLHTTRWNHRNHAHNRSWSGY